MAQELNSRPPRVLLMTQGFEPEPAFKGLVFAKALREQGLTLSVLTGFPNYPGGKVYPGYRIRAWQKEVMDGIPVTRVALYPSHDRSAMRRALNYLSFGVMATLGGLLRPRPDVIYAYHPPLTVGLAASLVGFIRRVPVVLDVQDLWPDTLRATGMIGNDWVLRAVGAVARFVYRLSTHIVVLSPGFRRLLIERDVPASKVEVIPNWCDEAALLQPIGRLPAGLPGPEYFRVVFAGNMGRAQGLDAVLEAVALLQVRAPQVRMVLIGGGVDATRLRDKAVHNGLTNIAFLEPVPMGEVGHVLAAADALLVHLRRDSLFEITIPSKTQAYMAVGRPVLMAVPGDAADLVARAGCGVTVPSEDAQALVNAVCELANMPPHERTEMGLRGQRYYQHYLSMATGTRRFAALFKQLAVSGRRTLVAPEVL
jgi:colanic acid biosynthesis glycosyl transferase WcaI